MRFLSFISALFCGEKIANFFFFFFFLSNINEGYKPAQTGCSVGFPAGKEWYKRRTGLPELHESGGNMILWLGFQSNSCVQLLSSQLIIF